MDSTESIFNKIEGDTFNERHKSLFKLLNSLSLSENKLDELLKNLQPKNYQESLFRVYALIHFKRIRELLEVLREGNEVFISKIIKQRWFITEAFEGVPPKIFVNEYLPRFSYSLRSKILKKVFLAANENEADELFDTLHNRYGQWFSTKYLQYVSHQKLVDVLNNNETELGASQVKFLFNKNVDSFIFYLEYYKRIYNRCYRHRKIKEYVAVKNPLLLLQLKREDKLEVTNLGRRTSKQVYGIIKDKVIKDVTKFKSLLKLEVIVKKLGNEFPSVYQQLFPKKLTNVNMYMGCNDFLKYYPKNKRWNLFYQTFTRNFGEMDQDTFTFNLTNQIFVLKPTKEIIQKWAAANYVKDKNNDFLKYYECSTAIKLIKEKINLTSDISARHTLVLLLIETCGYNKNFDCLEQVLKYICTRHRNEDSSFRKRLLDTIKRAIELNDLQESHWKYIMEIIKLQRIQGYFRGGLDFQREHLEYLFKNQICYRVQLEEYIDDVMYLEDYRLDFKNPEMDKIILQEIINKFAFIAKEDENYDKQLIGIITSIIRFNTANTEYVINFNEFPYISEYISAAFEKSDNLSDTEEQIIQSILIYCIKCEKNCLRIDDSKIIQKLAFVCPNFENEIGIWRCIEPVLAKPNRSELGNRLLELYLAQISSRVSLKDVGKWCLVNEPKTLVPYFDNLIKEKASLYIFDAKLIKLYSHFNFDKKIYEQHMKMLAVDDEDGSKYTKDKIVKYLAALLSTNEFAAVVSNHFLPKNEKVDLEDAEMTKFYKLQCEVAKKLHKVLEPSKMLPVVLNFCVGDYLQSTLPALYSVFYRSPEQELYSYTDTLSTKAVSVKKHAVFLSCDVLDRKHALKTLNIPKQRNLSSQKHVFAATLKYFRKNPSRELLDLVLANMSFIDKNDNESLEDLVSAKVPEKYKSLYVETCWTFYESLASEEVNIYDYLESLLLVIIDSEVILTALQSSFVNKILKEYFGRPQQELSNASSFAINVLKYRPNERSENFQIIFHKLINFSKDSITAFFEIFVEQIRADKIDKDFLEQFSRHWYQFFNIMVTFEERVFLNLLNLDLESSSVEDFAERVVEYLGEYIETFDLHVSCIVTHVLKRILANKSTVSKYKFYHHTIKFKTVSYTCIMVLQLMHHVDDDDENQELVELFKDINNILKDVDIHIVQIYYDIWARNRFLSFT